MLVLCAALFLISFALIQGRPAAWSWTMVAAGLAGLGAFTRLEQAIARRGRDPLGRMSLFRRAPSLSGSAS